MSRHAGVLVPLFSLLSSQSWGVGDLRDLVPMAQWLRDAGQDMIQLLPLNEMAPGQHSPYSAISAMAIDPIFIHVPAVEDFTALDEASRRELEELKAAPGLEYSRARRVKMLALEQAFDRFFDREWRRDSRRAVEFRAYVSREGWWLDTYSLFRALHAESDERSWLTWPDDLQRREPAALDAARERLSKPILFRQYLQWIAETEWQAARAAADPIRVFGDLPFTVDRDSADVWGAQEWFRLDASAGVPPDAFSESGQNWGLPGYRWDALEAADYRWLRDRARRSAALFDGYRIDHVVGFYRTYTIPDAGEPSFVPVAEEEQIALGERLMTIFQEAGASTIAEDLGTVPRFVRASLTKLGVPGYRVLRWEREWDEEGQPFREPSAYPPLSVAASGTHDTETMRAWWESAATEEREGVERLATIRAIVAARASPRSLSEGDFNETVRDVLLETLFAAGSDYLIVPLQDVFGWPDRINVPATVDETNWTWRVPVLVDRLDAEAEWRERQATMKSWAQKHRRAILLPPPGTTPGDSR